jgi:hypothetical protein
MTTPTEYHTNPPVYRERKPRPRRRGGEGASQNKSFGTTRRFISMSQGGEPYLPVDAGEVRPISARLRLSKRWYPSPCVSKEMNMPYIDNLGRFRGTNVAHWSADPRQVVASTVSTITQRLLKRCYQHEHNPKSRRKISDRADLLVKLSGYYALTKNLYFWDRVLFLTKSFIKNGALLHRLLISCLAKADASIRFVYSHVSFQTKWFLFRAERPRDKSALNEKRRPAREGTTLFREKFSNLLVDAPDAILRSAMLISEI